MKQPGAYIMKHVYKLSETADVAKFKLAWEQTVNASENLRSRIVNLDDSVFQVVISDDVQWEETTKTVQAFVSDSHSMDMGYGSRLNRYALIEEDGETYFVHICHHAVNDGWSMGLSVRGQLMLSTTRETAISSSTSPPSVS